MLSCAVLAGTKLHTNTLRSIRTFGGRIFTGSIDGKLKASRLSPGREGASPATTIEELETLQDGPAVTALCSIPQGLISCTENGLILRYTEEGGVEQISCKAIARISAVCYHEQSQTLFAGDWDGNFYSVPLDGQQPWAQTFPDFVASPASGDPGEAPPAEVHNSIFSLCCNDGALFCGLADGSIRVYPLRGRPANVQIGYPAAIIRKHLRPVRSLECLSQKGVGPFLSTGNDGALVYHWPVKTGAGLRFESLVISETFLADQYLLCSASFRLGEAQYVAVAGCDSAVYFFRVDGCMTGESSRVGLVGALPVISDVYCLEEIPLGGEGNASVGGDCATLAAGLETGELLVFQVSTCGFAELPASLQVAHGKYLAESAFGSRLLVPSRVTGKHESLVCAASAHCDSFARLSALPPDSPEFRGRLVVSAMKPEEMTHTPSCGSPAPAAGRAFAVLSSNSSWQVIGCLEEASARKKREDGEGNTWDAEIPVVNDRNQRTYKLFYNYGEDPYDVASRFLMQTDIIETDGYNTTEYKQEIARYVEKNMPATEIAPEYQVDTIPALHAAFSGALEKALRAPTWGPHSEELLSITGFENVAAGRDARGMPDVPNAQASGASEFCPKLVSYNLVRKCMGIISDHADSVSGYSSAAGDAGGAGDGDASPGKRGSSLTPEDEQALRDALFELECWFQGIREGETESPHLDHSSLQQIVGLCWTGPEKVVGACLCVLCFLLQDGRHSDVYEVIDAYFDDARRSSFERMLLSSEDRACTTFLVRLLAWACYDARPGWAAAVSLRVISGSPQRLLDVSSDEDLAAMSAGVRRAHRAGSGGESGEQEITDALLAILASEDEFLERFPLTFSALSS